MLTDRCVREIGRLRGASGAMICTPDFRARRAAHRAELHPRRDHWLVLKAWYLQGKNFHIRTVRRHGRYCASKISCLEVLMLYTMDWFTYLSFRSLRKQCANTCIVSASKGESFHLSPSWRLTTLGSCISTSSRILSLFIRT